VLAELGVFLLKLLDLLLKLAVGGAFLTPDGDSVFAIDYVPHEEAGEGNGQDGAGRTPGTLGEFKGALVEGDWGLGLRRGFDLCFLVGHCGLKLCLKLVLQSC